MSTRQLIVETLASLGIMHLLTIVILGCATFVARESDVRRETRETKARCEAAAQAGQDTTSVCRAHLKP